MSSNNCGCPEFNKLCRYGIYSTTAGCVYLDEEEVKSHIDELNAKHKEEMKAQREACARAWNKEADLDNIPYDEGNSIHEAILNAQLRKELENERRPK